MAKLTVEQVFLRAESHAKKGEIEQARSLLQAVVDAFPKNKRARAELAKLGTSKQQAIKIKHLSKEQIDALVVLYNRRHFSEMLEQAEALAIECPTSSIVWNIVGVASKAIGQLVKAEHGFRRATEIMPDFTEAHNNLGITLQEQGKLDDSIAAYERALALKPDYAEAYYNMGNALKDRGKLDDAIAAYQRALKIKPDIAEAYYNMGNALKDQGKLDDAIAAYQRALKIRSDNAEAYINMGVTLRDQGKLDDAIAAYERALALKPDYAEAYHNMGNALKDQGKLDDAIAAYQRALKIKPDIAEAYYNMGNALKDQEKLDDAIAAYQRALKIKPDYAEAYYSMGNALKDQGKLGGAIVAYQRTLKIKPDITEAYHNMGNAKKDQGKLDDAIAVYQRALKIKPDDESAEALMLHLQQRICDFSNAVMLSEASSRLGITKTVVSPFSTLSWSDNSEHQFLRSKNWALEKYKQSALPLPEIARTRPERLKVGYFSADFHNFPGMYLMAGLLETHNRDKFEIFAFSYGPDKNDEMRNRIASAVDHFIDIRNYSYDKAVEIAREKKIDIAIHRNGYTKNSRTELFQYRLAPIQINYLGYPGSLGADFIDYIVADPVVIPNDQRQFYSENVIYLPHTYQPNDDAREIAHTSTRRTDFGLPEGAFVFCCFNNNYKISPREFDIWMRLLSKVEHSILWLLKSNKWAEQNLRKEAAQRGIDPARLVFAEVLPQSEHLARHKHADLFVDTFNYNAHTTASDALWSGLPLVTKQGKQFAARVAASLLTAVGLPELITETEEEYESLILELATEPKKLKEIKAQLAENRLKEPLFDTKRYTHNFEHGLQQVYDLYFDGKQPEDIWVS